ncbi:MAG: hypothetical protein RLZZ360_648 [Candidatus Parcubacteria bacterium]
MGKRTGKYLYHSYLCPVVLGARYKSDTDSTNQEENRVELVYFDSN